MIHDLEITTFKQKHKLIFGNKNDKVLFYTELKNKS